MTAFEEHRTDERAYDTWYEEWKAERAQREADLRQSFRDALHAGKYLIERPGTPQMTVWPNAWRKSVANGSKTLNDVAEHVANRSISFGWEAQISDTVPVVERPGKTVAELRPILAEQGFTHVVTFAGPVPLEEWNPYGMNDQEDWQTHFRGELDGDKVRELGPNPNSPETPGNTFVRELWPLVTIPQGWNYI